MRPVIHLNRDGSGGGGTGTGWNGQVEFRSNLPITLGTPAVGEIYLVEKKTTLLGFTTYQSGLYRRDNNTGALSDWRRLNVKIQFTDSEFTIVSAADTSKRAKFDVSLVTASTTRTYIYPDKNGTIALLSDVVLQGLPSVLGVDNSTGTSDIDMTAGTALTESTTGAYLDLKDTTGAFGTGTYLNGEEAFVFLSDLDMYISTGVPFINPYTAAVQGSEDGLVLSLIGFPKYGTITIANNDSADFTSINLDQYCAVVCSKNSTVKQNVIGSVAIGGNDIEVKTDGSAYCNQIAYNDGLAGELIVKHTPSITDYTQTHQADNGIIALTKNIPKAFFAVDLDSAESSISRVVAGGRTTFTATHNLDTLDLKPEVFRLSDGRTLGWRVERTGVNTVEVSRNGNIADGLFRILI